MRFTKKPASEKAMDYLARRDHSELELRNKLRQKAYSSEEIESAISYVKEKSWLLEPHILSEKMKKLLERRGKGLLYINNYLKQKGLPSVNQTQEEQSMEALQLVQQKLGLQPPFQYDDKPKVARFLKNRGFLPGCIASIVYEN